MNQKAYATVASKPREPKCLTCFMPLMVNMVCDPIQGGAIGYVQCCKCERLEYLGFSEKELVMSDNKPVIKDCFPPVTPRDYLRRAHAMALLAQPQFFGDNRTPQERML